MKYYTKELYKDSAGKWRWRVVANTGDIVGDSGQGYERIGECKAGFRGIIIRAIFGRLRTVIKS